MAKPTLEYFDNSFIPYMSSNYAVMIANYPDLGPMVSSMEIPSRSINRYRAELMGKSRAFPGRRVSASNEITMTMLLNRRTQNYQQLLAILESFSENGTGNIVGATFPIRAVLYDDVGIESIIFTFNDCWLADIGALQLEASSEAEIIAVPCVFCYSEMTYQFTGVGTIPESIRTTILSRFDNRAVSVGSMTPEGLFPNLGISQLLQGSDPMDVINTVRSKLESIVGITTAELRNISNVISTVRSGTTSLTSKAAALSSLRSTAQSAVSGKLAAGIRSLF